MTNVHGLTAGVSNILQGNPRQSIYLTFTCEGEDKIMMRQLIRKCVPLAAIVLSMASVNVSAQCTAAEKDLEAFNIWIEASENQTLVNAYHNKQCEIIEGLHGGGKPCPGTNIKSHITVKILPNGPTCHVFDHPKIGPNCTTCE